MTLWDRGSRMMAKIVWDAGTWNGKGTRAEVSLSGPGGQLKTPIAAWRDASSWTLRRGPWAEIRRTPNRCCAERTIGERCWTWRAELMFTATTALPAATSITTASTRFTSARQPAFRIGSNETVEMGALRTSLRRRG